MEMVAFGAYGLTGILSGLLAGMLGLGGGVVIVPTLILVFGFLGFEPDWIPQLAVGTSLATILGTGGASVLAHHRRGAVRWDLFLRLAAWIVLGAWLGAALAGILPALWLQRLFGGFLVFVGGRLLWHRAPPPREDPPGRLDFGLAGLGIGTLSSLVGIGGGTLTVPFLVKSGVDMRRAVATASACGLPIALAGALGFLAVGWGREGLPPGSTGFLYWPAVGAILLASVPMAPLGARLAHTLPVDRLRRFFAILVLILGGKLLLE